jgi:hypothetical protein
MGAGDQGGVAGAAGEPAAAAVVAAAMGVVLASAVAAAAAALPVLNKRNIEQWGDCSEFAASHLKSSKNTDGRYMCHAF